MFRRSVSSFVILSMLSQFVFVPQAFAGSGPAQPEAAQFEPVDAKDMVNLYTGDFTYSVPLLEVPGPEGGWPISMSYHAGIGPNTEATWVGLGWTLNPGSINRFVNGYPDDMFNGQMESHYQIDKVKGWGVGIGISYGPVGMSVNFASNQSGLGFNATLSLVNTIAIITNSPTVGSLGNVGGANVGFDVSLSAGTSGVGLSGSLGVGAAFGGGIGGSLGISAGVHSSSKPSFGAGGGIGWNDKKTNSPREMYNSMSLMGVNWSSNGGGASFSVAGTGFQSQSQMDGKGQSNSSSWSIPIPIGLIFGIPGLGMSISYYEWEWWLDEKHYDSVFGSLHQLSFLGHSLDDVWGDFFQSTNPYNFATMKNYFNGLEKSQASTSINTDVFSSTKTERNIVNSVLFSSEDNYVVNAQGISGSFKPYFDYAYKLYDETGTDKNGKYELYNNELNTGDHIIFRFDNDEGSNFVSKSSNTASWEEITPITANYQFGSKKINPVINPATGELSGFHIIAEDGKIYEFFKPVYNYYYNTKTVLKTEVANINTNYKNANSIKSPYVTSWLLTGVKGPDYVDVSSDGFTSDDYGYWIKFNYEGTQVQSYRTPFEADSYDQIPGNVNGRMFSEGLRGVVYLESIETSTHIANFNKSIRVDDKSAQLNSFSMDIKEYSIMSGNSSINFKLPISLEAYNQIVNSISFHIQTNEYCFYQPGYPCFEPKVYNWSGSEIYGVSEVDGLVVVNVAYKDFLSNTFTVDAKTADINPITLQSSPAMELNSITLTKQGSNEIIEGIAFDSDYLLVPGSNNSEATSGRKLTLKGIKKLGKGGVSILPSTQFGYNSNNPDGAEAQWGRYKYDNWNGYTSAGQEESHFNSQTKTQADNDAGMWSLSSIITPLGATINMDYESDQINAIKDYPIRLLLDNDIVWDPSKIIFVYPWVGNTIQYIPVTSEIAQAVTEKMNSGLDCYVAEGNTSMIKNAKVDHVYLEPADGQYYLVLTEEVEFKMNNETGAPYVYGIYPMLSEPFFANPIFAGGHRVRSITVTDGAVKNKTLYTYGYGITPVLPSEYTGMLTWEGKQIEGWFLINGNFNSLGPSPAVGYERVEVAEVNPTNDEPLYGKVVNEFYTSRDKDWRFEVYYYYYDPKIKIVDNSGIYGRMKSITTYGLEPGTTADFYPLQKSEFIYKNSSQLAAESGININKKGTVYPTKPKLGLTQQKYLSQNLGNEEKKIDHQRENIYMTGTKSTKWYYDDAFNETGTVVAEMKNIGYDALTGKVLVSVNYNSKNEQVISEQVPAYWKYPAMETKNMLTQLAETHGYFLPVAVDFNSLTTSTSKSPYRASASITTWQNWGNNVWRQKDNYSWVGKTNYSDFTHSDPYTDLGDMVPSASNKIWQRTSNITRYDNYGHPIEELAIDGQYTSSIYSYSNALPVAIAANAKNSELNFLDFENGVNGGWGSWYTFNGSIISTDKHTGNSGWSFHHNTYGVLSKTFQASEIVPNKKYLLSGWVKTTSTYPNLLWCVRYNNGSSETYPASVSAQGTGTWEYVSLTLDLSAYANITEVFVFVRNGGSTYGNCVWDDIRFRPADASMSTYTYDPLTWKVTSITDKNNLTTYFEYDNAGRLVLVRDQDRNILKRHAYTYGKDLQ